MRRSNILLLARPPAGLSPEAQGPLPRLRRTLSEEERDLLLRPPDLLFRVLAPRVPLPFGEGPRSGGEVPRLQAIALRKRARGGSPLRHQIITTILAIQPRARIFVN